MRKLKNNKGFTLVEMIIVIAVMAILGVVVSPQLIKYIETSRRATDRDAVWAVARAAQIAYGTEEMDDNTVIMAIDKDGGVKYGAVPVSGLSNASGTIEGIYDVLNKTGWDIEKVSVYKNDILDKAVSEVVPTTSYQYKSDLYRNSDIMITIDEASGTVIITTGDSYTDKLDIYKAEKKLVDGEIKVLGDVKDGLTAISSIFTALEKNEGLKAVYNSTIGKYLNEENYQDYVLGDGVVITEDKWVQTGRFPWNGEWQKVETTMKFEDDMNSVIEKANDWELTEIATNLNDMKTALTSPEKDADGNPVKDEEGNIVYQYPTLESVTNAVENGTVGELEKSIGTLNTQSGDIQAAMDALNIDKAEELENHLTEVAGKATEE